MECCGSEWYLLQRAAFVIDRNDHIVYAEYNADQMGTPDYAAVIQAVELATVGDGSGEETPDNPIKRVLH
jgi:peroxiredoxin